MTYFKGWNIYDMLFLFAAIIVPTIFLFALNSDPLTVFVAIFFLMYIQHESKAKPMAFVFGLIMLALYTVLVINLSLYGEIIVNVGIILPVCIYGLVSWFKNKRKCNERGVVVIVNKIKHKEFVLVTLAVVVLGVGTYFMLDAFNTEFLILSTLSIMTAVFANYFLARRNQLGTLVSLPYDIVQLTLWITVTVTYDTSAAVLIASVSMGLINDIYGYFTWRKLRKSQLLILSHSNS